jgi:hypothetical protein
MILIFLIISHFANGQSPTFDQEISEIAGKIDEIVGWQVIAQKIDYDMSDEEKSSNYVKK